MLLQNYDHVQRNKCKEKAIQYSKACPYVPAMPPTKLVQLSLTPKLELVSFADGLVSSACRCYATTPTVSTTTTAVTTTSTTSVDVVVTTSTEVASTEVDILTSTVTSISTSTSTVRLSHITDISHFVHQCTNTMQPYVTITLTSVSTFDTVVVTKTTTDNPSTTTLIVQESVYDEISGEFNGCTPSGGYISKVTTAGNSFAEALDACLPSCHGKDIVHVFL